MPQGRRPRGVTPRPRSAAAAESTRLRQRRNGREELPSVRGQGWQLGGATHAPGQGPGREELPSVRGQGRRLGGPTPRPHARGQGRWPGGPIPVSLLHTYFGSEILTPAYQVQISFSLSCFHLIIHCCGKTFHFLFYAFYHRYF